MHIVNFMTTQYHPTVPLKNVKASTLHLRYSLRYFLSKKMTCFNILLLCNLCDVGRYAQFGSR
jgi:hypothetical protein